LFKTTFKGFKRHWKQEKFWHLCWALFFHWHSDSVESILSSRSSSPNPTTLEKTLLLKNINSATYFHQLLMWFTYTIHQNMSIQNWEVFYEYIYSKAFCKAKKSVCIWTTDDYYNGATNSVLLPPLTNQ